MSFDALGLTPELLRAVADQGYTEPTPVQREAIPFVLAGRDILAGAQTGTGKTAAFVLPILQLLNAERTPGWKANGAPEPVAGPNGASGANPNTGPRRDPRIPHSPIRVLILTPTRELALQVEESVRTYGAHRRIRSVAIYGGVGYEPQIRALRAGPGIVVATPGRLLDHIAQRNIDLSKLEILVLDEADRMLDMGFIRDIRKVMALLPRVRQTLLFSATFSDEIRHLAGGILTDPAMVQVTPRNTETALVTQIVHPVDRERKRELLSELIRSGRVEQALVFTRTKHGANRLAEQLGKDGIGAAAIHGNKSQGQRVRALDDFKAGRVAILVATEVASRGLDIEQLPHVVNYELPMVAEDYVHRIGRTGRAGATGDAISLVCVDEGPLLREIEKLVGHAIPSEVIPGFEPDRSIRAEPIRQRSAGPRFTSPARGVGPRPIPAGQRGGAAAHRDRGPIVTHHGPIRQPSAAGFDNGQGPRRDGPRPGAPGSDINRGGGVPGPRRRPNSGGPRPGQHGQRRPAPAGAAIGNGGGPRPNWTAERTGQGRDDRGRGSNGGRGANGNGHSGGNDRPSGPRTFEQLPGERLARANRPG
ncbi:MAG TPA: DEAD/DEAH box helicase [Patescibacteria group bacterium]|nr:DEAD/DEAH box helicase [Patescibacteria group bacterium]